MCILANSEDPAEMLHSVSFHQDLHCLLNRKQSLEKEIQSYLETITCDPSIIYTINCAMCIASNQKEEFISALKG